VATTYKENATKNGLKSKAAQSRNHMQKLTWIMVIFSKHTDTGSTRVVSGIKRLENHKAPSVDMSGHSTGSSAKTTSKEYTASKFY